MSATLANSRGGATLSRPGPGGPRRKGPRVVLAAVAAQVAEQLRKQGWDVHTAEGADDAARLALCKHAAAVVIPAETAGESGYLVCAKLRRSRPDLRVLLVGAERTAKAEHFSKFVGGSFAPAATLADEVAKLVV
jgi:hypothetical protein